MKNLQDCFQRKRQLTANTRNKKEMRDYQIAKQNVESFYAAQQSWDIEEDMKRNGSRRGKHTSNHQKYKWVVALFFIFRQSRNVSALTK